MRLASVLSVFFMMLFLTGAALADPNAPAEPKGWEYVPSGSIRATIPEVEPNDACTAAMTVQPGDVVDPASIASGTDVDWYILANVPAGYVITVATDDGTVCGAPFLTDSYVELYYACGTTRVAYDDDGGPGYYSLLTYTVPAGAGGEYEIKVRGYSSSYTGCYKVTITADAPPPPPANDTCATAIPLCGSGTLSGSTATATNDYSLPSGTASCTGYTSAGRDIVYSLALHAGDAVSLSYTQLTADASFYILSDCGTLTCVVGADATFSGQAETISWTATADGIYYLILDSYGTSTGGAFTLTYDIPCWGACCAADGSCTITLQANCVSPAVWHGEWTACSPNPCPISGAVCCAVDGSCSLTSQELCLSPSIWHPEWTACSPENPCPQPPPLGACCDRNTGACTQTHQTDCSFVWLGAGIACDLTTCPVPVGACCAPDGACLSTTQADCAAPGIWTLGLGCDPNPCLQPSGACCVAAAGGNCSMKIQSQCSGLWLGYGSTCTPNPCLGVCCSSSGTCSVVHEFECTYLNGWHPEWSSCDPNNCPVLTGACCVNANCVVLNEVDCAAQSGTFKGVGTVCTPTTCIPPVPVEHKSWGQVKSNYR